MKKTVVNLLKFGVALAIVGYLIYDALSDETFATLKDQPKHWGCFAAALGLCTVATCLTFVRWYYLVRALELPFHLSDAFRLGFLGYLMNFMSLGSVGGDLFKAVFIAREQKTKRAEAVATVVIDRVVGLYALFVVATVAAFWTGLIHSQVREIQVLVQATVWCTIGGGIFIAALLIPGFTQGRASKYLRQLPRVGQIFARLLEGIRMYRTRLGVVALAGLLSIGVHVLNTVGIYLIARGLPGDYPSLGEHFIIVSLAMLAGAVPITPSGLGAFEGAMDFLYRAVPSTIEVARGEGLLVAFGFRFITIIIALIGVCYYLRSRRDVAAVLAEAEHLSDDDGNETPDEASGAQRAQLQPSGKAGGRAR